MLGNAIRYYLQLKRMTQAELSKKVGVTTAATSQFIRGVRTPSLDTLRNIADALGVSVSELQETARSYETDIENTNKFTEERRLKRHLDMIYNRSDLVIELTDTIILSGEFMVRDIAYESTDTVVKRYTSQGRKPCAVEVIMEKVVREFLNDNLNEIADRVEKEINDAKLTLEKIVTVVRNDYDKR